MTSIFEPSPFANEKQNKVQQESNNVPPPKSISKSKSKSQIIARHDIHSYNVTHLKEDGFIDMAIKCIKTNIEEKYIDQSKRFDNYVKFMKELFEHIKNNIEYYHDFVRFDLLGSDTIYIKLNIFANKNKFIRIGTTKFGEIIENIALTLLRGNQNRLWPYKRSNNKKDTQNITHDVLDRTNVSKTKNLLEGIKKITHTRKTEWSKTDDINNHIQTIVDHYDSQNLSKPQFAKLLYILYCSRVYQSIVFNFYCICTCDDDITIFPNPRLFTMHRYVPNAKKNRAQASSISAQFRYYLKNSWIPQYYVHGLSKRIGTSGIVGKLEHGMNRTGLKQIIYEYSTKENPKEYKILTHIKEIYDSDKSKIHNHIHHVRISKNSPSKSHDGSSFPIDPQTGECVYPEGYDHDRIPNIIKNHCKRKSASGKKFQIDKFANVINKMKSGLKLQIQLSPSELKKALYDMFKNIVIHMESIRHNKTGYEDLASEINKLNSFYSNVKSEYIRILFHEISQHFEKYQNLFTDNNGQIIKELEKTYFWKLYEKSDYISKKN